MSNKRMNIFISHYGKDEEEIPKLKKLLTDRGYKLFDSSITKEDPNNAHNPDYIKSKYLKPAINFAGTVLVLIGPKTHEREYVDWEIKYASKNGDKRVIGVYMRGATDSDIPQALSDYGDACVAWNSDKLIDAIEGDNIWNDSNGNYRNDNPVRGDCYR